MVVPAAAEPRRLWKRYLVTTPIRLAGPSARLALSQRHNRRERQRLPPSRPRVNRPATRNDRMITAASAPSRTAPVGPVSAASVAVVLALVTSAYLGASHLRLVGAVAACVAIAAWALIAFRQPRTATIASIGMVLVAGTKFRLREATDTLAGVVDWQIALELGMFALVGVAVMAIFASGRFHRTRSGAAEALIVAYVALALLSTSWSEAPVLTLVRAVQLSVVAGLAIVSIRVLSPSRAIWTACCVLATYVAACALSTAVFAPDTTADFEEPTFRFAWFAVHPIAAGTLAAIAALGMFSPSLFRRAGAHRIAGIPRLLMLASLLVILVLTNARGPLLAFLAGAGILILMRTIVPIRLLLFGTAGAVLFAFLLTGADFRSWLAEASSHESIVTRMLLREQTVDTVLSLNGRLELWSDLRPAIAAHPVFGYGYQASREVVLDTAPWAAFAHNALLQTMLDLGGVGAVAFIALVVLGCTGAFRRTLNPWLRASLAALMVFLAVNSISTESFAGSPGFETLIFMVCVLCAAPRAEMPQ